MNAILANLHSSTEDSLALVSGHVQSQTVQMCHWKYFGRTANIFSVRNIFRKPRGSDQSLVLTAHCVPPFSITDCRDAPVPGRQPAARPTLRQ